MPWLLATAAALSLWAVIALAVVATLGYVS